MKTLKTIYDLLKSKDLILCKYEGEPVVYMDNVSSPLDDITLDKDLLIALDYLYPRRIIKKEGNIISHHNNKLFSVKENASVEDIEQLKNIMQQMMNHTKDKRFKSLSELKQLLIDNIPEIAISFETVEEKFNYWASPDKHRTMWISERNWEENYFKNNKSSILFEIPYRYPENILNKNFFYDYLKLRYNNFFIDSEK